jgi:hypothetical protein
MKIWAVRTSLVTAAAASLCLSAPSAAVADGDPASDFLVSQRVFVPFHAPTPVLKQQLVALAYAAKREGFLIRVAVIQSAHDLGANPELLGKPKIYARFLGAELLWVHKRNRLLVVMGQGYGYTRGGHPITGAANAVAALPHPAGNSPDELTRAAIVALRRLAADAGHPLPALKPRPEDGPHSGSSASFLILHHTAIGVVSLILSGFGAAVAIILLVRLRRPGGPRDHGPK